MEASTGAAMKTGRTLLYLAASLAFCVIAEAISQAGYPDRDVRLVCYAGLGFAVLALRAIGRINKQDTPG